MLGTIKSGTRAHAIEIMVSGYGQAVHESFGPGVFFEFDAHKEIFVSQDGHDVTKLLFEDSEVYLNGWHAWNKDDEAREDKYMKELERIEAEEEAEAQRRLDANVGGYNMRDFVATVYSDDSHIYYRLAKNGNTGRGRVKGFRLTVKMGNPSVEYLVKYDTTGCQEWLIGSEVFASKLDLTAHIMESV